MLSLLGFLTVLIVLAAIMSKKMIPVVALITIPILSAILGGFRLEIPKFIIEGIKSIAPTGTMFIFAILFFGLLKDAGTFQPIIDTVLKKVGSDPIKICIGTALLAMFVHLDGSGAVTFLITIPALLPLYDELGMKRTTLSTIVALSAGVMNILPWGGPTLRAATSLGIPVTELFNPLLIPFISGIIFVLALAFCLGKKEKFNLKTIEKSKIIQENNEKIKITKPMFFINLLTIFITISILISGKINPTVTFMLMFSLSLVLNFPSIKKQKEIIDSHAKEALMMASILFAAGAFIGIMQKSGMIEAMSNSLVSSIPYTLGKYIAIITGILSMPASLLFDPDSFYFGILPILSNTGSQFSIPAIAVGRAAILGQMTTGFPVSPLTGSTFLLIGLTGVELGEHQKKTIPYAFLTTIVMLTISVLTGALYKI